MRTQGIDIQEISNITAALSHFGGLASYLPQLDYKDPVLQAFCQALQDKHKVKKWYEVPFGDWDRIDFHVSLQMWGSTATGWGGMGGAAMTEQYTVVVENSYLGIAGIYWGGQLAYLVEMNVKYYDYIKTRGYNIPSRRDSGTHFDLIYASKR